MKTTKTIFLLIIGFTLLSFTLSNSSIFQQDLEDVGIIKQSLLKPNQFNKTQKGSWVLLDGSLIEKDTKLFNLLEENFDLNILTLKDNKYYLPNASGAFLRSSNVNGQGFDPESDRKIGSLQNDAFQGHKHFSGTRFATYHGKQSSNTPKQRHNVTESVYDNSAGIHDAGNGKPRIANETRPINISVYTYIKISN
jgi:hypothetical protein